ncbi:MAG: hypothetical protein AABZ53_17155, partial [Planctomycetota bacterium]
MIQRDIAVELSARRDAVAEELGAIDAALAIGNLDPHAITDLRAFLSDLKGARERGDQASAAYVLDAIAGLFRPTDMNAAVDNESVLAALEATSAGAEALKRTQERATRFAATYRRLKEGAGVSTQQEVAALCGLGLATVQAMEAIGTPQG